MSVENEKESRTQAIFRLIEENVIGTQAELVDALEVAGFEVTQATVSRDVRRLGLIKIPMPRGGYRYAPPTEVRSANPNPDALLNVRSFVTKISVAEAFCVLNTLPGRAMTIAVTIDELRLPGVVGTLAGDDLILVMIGRKAELDSVLDALYDLFGDDML